MEEKFIDKYINSKLEEEEGIILPEVINIKVEHALSLLPEKKKMRRKRFSVKAAGIFLAFLLCFGAVLHTYAEELFDSIFQVFSKQELFISEQHLKYATHVEQKANDKEIEIGVTEVLCDDNNITLGYYIKNAKRIKYGPQIWGQKLLVDGKEINPGSGSGLSDKIAKNTYARMNKFQVDNLPEKFTLEWSVTNISGVEGKWDFKFTVDKGAIDKNSKIIEINRDVKIGEAIYKIGKVKYTPIESIIEMTGIEAVKGTQPSSKEEFAYQPVGFVVTDEKGNVLGNTRGFKSNIVDNNRVIDYDFNFRANELPKTLNIIPYKTEAISNKTKYYSIKGKEAIEIEDSDLGKFIISSIERNSDTLTLKLKAELNNPIIQMPAIGLKGIFSDFVEHNLASRQLADLLYNGKEVELKFTGLKKWKSYKLFYQNIGEGYVLENNNKIIVPLN